MSAQITITEKVLTTWNRRSQRLKPLSAGPMCKVETAQERGDFQRQELRTSSLLIPRETSWLPSSMFLPRGAEFDSRGILDGGEWTFIGGERIAAGDARYLHEAIGSRVGNGYSCKVRSTARLQAKLELHWQAVRAIRQQAWTKRSTQRR
jgi:hypothetical protein